MALEEFYEMLGGDLPGVRGRLLTDERVAKFVGVFLGDSTFGRLSSALADDDLAEAFRCAHTLKGLSRDMGFTALADAATDLTEDLRPDSEGLPARPDAVPQAMARVEQAYSQVRAAAEKALAGEAC